MSAPVLGCKWCGKKLGAKFDRLCKDCGHSMYLHQFTVRTDGKNCVATQNCTCKAIQSRNLLERTSEQFPRQRIGFGVDALNLFCTKDCAVRWAHKYAALKA